jgi:anti-anti-sigma factor
VISGDPAELGPLAGCAGGPDLGDAPLLVGREARSFAGLVKIDMVTAPEFQRVLENAIRGSWRIELDLRETTFMDSTGLAVLVAAHQQLGQAREAILLREPPPMIRTLLDVSGVAELVDIRPDGMSKDVAGS